MVTADAAPSPHRVATTPAAKVRITALTSRQVVVTMWWLVAAQLAVRTYASASGYLYWDDFILQSRAARLPFPSVELLLTDHDGHLMPGAMVVAWVVTHLAPLSPWGVTVCLVLLQALASGAVVVMLQRVFGARPLVLVPLAVYLFAPLTLPSFLWWSAALNALPLQAALAFAIWAHVGYLRGGNRGDAILAFAATVAALAFFEKSVLVPVALLGVTWVLSPGRGFLRPLVHAVVRHWRVWLAYLVLMGGYLVAFVRLVDRGSRVGSAADLVAVTRRGLFEAFVPAAAGGPVRWVPMGFANAVADPPGWLVWSTVVGATLVVGWSCWARARARRAWVLLLGYVLADLASIVIGRGGTPFTELLPLSLRYTADASVLFAFAIGIALAAPAHEPEPQRVVATRAWLARQPARLWAVAFVAVDVFLLLTVMSTVGLTSIWAGNPARPWVENAVRGLRQSPADQPILPQPVPEAVLYGLAYPENLTSNLLRPVSGPHAFGLRTPVLTTFDGFGQLGAGRVDGAASEAPPDSVCWPVENGHGLVRLDERLAPWEYTVHLRYQATGGSGGSVALGGGEPAIAVIEQGQHDEYVRVTGGGSVLSLTLTNPDVSVCVGQAQVGDVVPAGWAVP